MSTSDVVKYRPAPEHRWLKGRSKPGTITVRTRFLYSEPDPKVLVPQRQARHAFARGGDVISTDWPSNSGHMQDVASHIHRAVASFSDDAEVEISVRLVRRLDPEECS